MMDEQKQSGNSTVTPDVEAVAAAAARAAVRDYHRRQQRKKWQMLAAAAVLLAVLALVVTLYLSHIRKAAETSVTAHVPSAIQELLPDEELGYNAIDFTTAILGEAREQANLIVLEQDVAVDSEISHALANLDIFKKTKVIHSYGVGVYTVDLSKLGQDDIQVDLVGQSIQVTIPHAVLQYTNVDSEKTTYEDTTRTGLFGFGDITLTGEQKQILDEEVLDKMHAQLQTKQQYLLADQAACRQVRGLCQPLVAAISEDFQVTVTTDADTSGQVLYAAADTAEKP